MNPTPPASPKPTCTTQPEDRLGYMLRDRIRLDSILGVGAYGVVYKARDVHTGVPFAVKALNKLGLEPRQQRFQQREIELHRRVSQHPNIVSMRDIIESADCTFVVLDFCPEGDLFAKITEEERYVGNDDLTRNVFLQILNAVEYCHSLGIYHRDLKPENILVENNGRTVKLADFGLATTDMYTSDFGCGSTFYMSPECQQTNPLPGSCYQSSANDIWSLGVILVNLTCGRNPWKRASMEDSTFKAYMRDRNFLKTILPVSDELDAILRRVFEPSLSHRITIPELRDLIMRCSRFTQTNIPASLPTPPQSPIETPVDNGYVYNYAPTPAHQQDIHYQAAQTLASFFSPPYTAQAQQAYSPPVQKIRSPAAPPFVPAAPKACASQAYFTPFANFQNYLMPVLSRHANFCTRVV